jgi:hypothetical protein
MYKVISEHRHLHSMETYDVGFHHSVMKPSLAELQLHVVVPYHIADRGEVSDRGFQGLPDLR